MADSTFPFLTQNEFDVDYFCGTGFVNKGMHKHAYHELLFILQGELKFLTGNDIYQSSGSCIIFFKESQLHTTDVDATKPYERYNLAFHLRALDDEVDYSYVQKCFSNGCFILSLTDEERDELAGFIRPLYRLRASDSAKERALARLAFSAALVRVDLLLQQRGNNDPHKVDTYLTFVLDRIHQNLSGKLTVQSIADAFFVSRSKLMGDFKRATGMALGEYIITARLRLAKDCLLAGASVKDAAEQSGFVNTCHFIRTFKKSNGVTPLQYSKRRR